MSTSLIPERPLLISPTLAATIGLEEAVMLHVISELILQHPPQFRNRRRWVALPWQQLGEHLPFWENAEISRIHQNLLEKGLLLSARVDGRDDAVWLAINQAESGTSHQPVPAAQPPAAAPAPARPAPDVFSPQAEGGRATPISPDWQPDETLYRQCLQQHGIPRDFIEQRVASFVMYQHERGKPQYSWHNTFLKWILREWRQEESHRGARERSSDMSASWQPDEDAVSILEHAGISRDFIEDSVPEFVLYWRERGMVTSTWNTKFIAHVRRQWAKYSAMVENDAHPRPIPADYEPSPACFEVLAMANIDTDFARAQIPEFILYWQERGEAGTAWHTRFLQHVKYKWASRARSELPPSEQLESTLQRMTDRSWAD